MNNVWFELNLVNDLSDGDACHGTGSFRYFYLECTLKMTSSFADLKDPRQCRGKGNKEKLGRIK